nr:hypothetical protein [Corynebacterium marquesiae]
MTSQGSTKMKPGEKVAVMPWEARVSLTVASTSRGGLGRAGKGLVIVQAQVIAAILRGENGDLEKPRVGR